jgi:plasmid stability protein
MTLHIEHVPDDVTQALEARAAEEGRSVADVAIEAMAKGLEQAHARAKKRDLSRFRGKWIEDPETDKALEEFERVEEDRPQ